MDADSKGAWKWFLLVIGLACLRGLILYSADALGAWLLRRPSWPILAFLCVFYFPASIVFSFVTPDLEDRAIIISVATLTLSMWGCIWAEPFRRRYGWKPWQFRIKDILIVTTIVGLVLGFVVWMSG